MPCCRSMQMLMSTTAHALRRPLLWQTHWNSLLPLCVHAEHRGISLVPQPRCQRSIFWIYIAVPLLDHLNQELQVRFFKGQKTIRFGFSLHDAVTNAPSWLEDICIGVWWVLWWWNVSSTLSRSKGDPLGVAVVQNQPAGCWRHTNYHHSNTESGGCNPVSKYQLGLMHTGNILWVQKSCVEPSPPQDIHVCAAPWVERGSLGCMVVIHVHYHQPIDLDDVVRHFIRPHPRRKQLVSVRAD